MDFKNAENQIKKIKDTSEPVGEYPIHYKGETRSEKVYEIDPNLLRFNYLNGRIGTEVIEYTQIHGTDLTALNVNEVNDLIHNWIWEKSKSENKRTLKDIEDKHQIQPGVITRDGIVVDGNRRFMISRILNEKGFNRMFKTIILDDTYSDGGEKEFQIKRLEAEIQMGQDEKVKYGAIEPYIRVMEFVDDYIDIDSPQMDYADLCDLMDITSENKAKDIYRIGKLMLEFLKYNGFDNMWSRLEKTEDLFISLEKTHKLYSSGKGSAQWDFDNNDIKKYKKHGFDLIRWNYNCDPKSKGDWESKKIREIYFKNSKDKTIFSNPKIWEDFVTGLGNINDNPLPDLNDLVKEAELNHADAAKKIDQIWANNASDNFKTALGKAESRLTNKQNTDQPEKFLKDALDKLINLLDEDSFNDEGKIELDVKKVLVLKDEDKLEQNLSNANQIRKIAESLKKALD